MSSINLRKILVVSILKRSEELRLYNLMNIVTVSNPSLKAAFLNASPGCTVHFLGVLFGVFWKRESRPIKWHQRSLLTRRQLFSVFSLFTSIVNMVQCIYVNISMSVRKKKDSLGFHVLISNSHVRVWQGFKFKSSLGWNRNARRNDIVMSLKFENHRMD